MKNTKIPIEVQENITVLNQTPSSLQKSHHRALNFKVIQMYFIKFI